MATSHDYNGAIQPVAPAGGTTAGTIYSVSNVVCLALETATSGNTFVAKVAGRVNGVAKISGTAWTAGLPLAHDGTAFTHVTTGAAKVVAHAAVAAASTATSGDVILRLPSANTPA